MKQFITLTLLLFACSASAITLDEILRDIERNNTRLAALRSENAATVAQLSSETSIVGPTSVEYSPFFGNGSGLASSELIVSQEFDFPTLGSMRKENNKAQERVLDLQYTAQRRDVLLEARKLCYDISEAVNTRLMLESRLRNADTLLILSETSMKHGNATIIDVNRVKTERMTVNTQLVQTRGEINKLATQLQALNGGVLIEGVDRLTMECAIDAVGGDNSSLEEDIARAQFNASTQEITVAQKGWLPSLTVGYRRNTEWGDATNGFVVGVSMPLFSNTGKVKAARARQQAAQAMIDDARTEAQNRDRNLRAEAEQLRATIASFDFQLMQETLELINRAVKAGALTVTEYYNQADRIHAAMLENIALNHRYAKIITELNRHTL